jgi:hypothetical protein
MYSCGVVSASAESEVPVFLGAMMAFRDMFSCITLAGEGLRDQHFDY